MSAAALRVLAWKELPMCRIDDDRLLVGYGWATTFFVLAVADADSGELRTLIP